MLGLGVASPRTFIMSQPLIRRRLIGWNVSGSISIGRAVIPRIPQNCRIAGPVQFAGYKSILKIFG